MNEFGTLYVIATPIGNLADITLRALDIIKAVKVLYAEDTRVTQRLLEHYGVQAKLQSLHDYSESSRIAAVMGHLQSGYDVGLVSDAGTPLISDPGYKLIVAIREAGLRVRSIPGASALTAGLSICGLPTDRFTFEGFLPRRSSERSRLFGALRFEPRTMVFYESPQRIQASVQLCGQIMGVQRRAVLLREMTKYFEQHIFASLGEITAQLEQQPENIRGEIVFVLEGNPDPDDVEKLENAVSLLSELQRHLPLKEAAVIVSKYSGIRRNRLYSLGLQARSKHESQ